jgi:hypothetical protein
MLVRSVRFAPLTAATNCTSAKQPLLLCPTAVVAAGCRCCSDDVNQAQTAMYVCLRHRVQIQ